MNNYCSCCWIRPEGLLYDAERDLRAIAKFLVILDVVIIVRCYDHYVRVVLFFNVAVVLKFLLVNLYRP